MTAANIPNSAGRRDYPATALTDAERAQLIADLSNLAAVTVRLAALVPSHTLREDLGALDLSGLDESALMALLAALTGRILGREVDATP